MLVLMMLGEEMLGEEGNYLLLMLGEEGNYLLLLKEINLVVLLMLNLLVMFDMLEILVTLLIIWKIGEFVMLSEML